MDKENHPLTRKELFNKYKLDNKIFFETGTHKGESVQTALDLGFEKVVTVELIHNFFNECAFKFIDKPNVNLFYGHSNDELEHIKNHTIKTHTIIVDDIPLYFGDGEKVKEKILEINPDYKFVIEDALNEGNGKNMENWDLIAYI